MVDKAKKTHRDRRRRRRFVRLLAVLALLPLLAVRVWDPSLVEALRVRVFDIYQVLAPRDTARNRVVVVGVDDASLRALGQWPWPRTLVARLIETIGAAGATAIGIDIVFAEPDRFSPDRLVELFPDLGPELRAALGRMARNDDVLAAAIDSAPVVLSRVAVADAVGADAGGADAGGADTPAPPPLRRAGDPLPHLFAFGGLLPNLPALEAAAAAHGVVSLVPEGDGIVRRVPALVRIGDDIHPALSVEMLRLMQDAALTEVRAGAGGIEAVRVGALTIPTDRTGRIWVRYGPRDTARTVSAASVLSGEIAPDVFAGRPVLIGVSAAALQDIKSTPVDPAIPGVEIHAQIIDGALSDALLRRPDFALALELVIALGIGLLLVWLVPALGAAWTLLIGGVFAAALVAVSGLLFLRASILLDPSFPILATGLVFLFLVAANYLREEGQRREIRGAFARYLSPTVVERLVADPSQLRLGGETRELTILFCDIRGFTAISEGLKADPAALTQLVNMLLTPLTDAVLRHGGTIDKYMGDCIMAFWNAPLDDPDHRDHAIATALAMLAALDEVNAARRAADPAAPALRVGIGINTGSCVVGNMGSEQRFDYSALGDAVNLAARLEGQTRLFDVDIIVGEETARASRDGFALLELDRVAVKGKTEPVRISAVLGDQSVAADPAFADLAAEHDAMLAAYRQRQWAEAAARAKRCATLGVAPAALYGLYRRRFAALQANPPPSEDARVAPAHVKQ